MKKLLTALTILSLATVATAATPAKDEPHGPATQFTVQTGDYCAKIGHHIGQAHCGDDSKVYYIGGDHDMESEAWCTYKDGAWHEVAPLQPQAEGWYACITN